MEVSGDKWEGLEAKLRLHDENRGCGVVWSEKWWEWHLMRCGIGCEVERW